MFATMTPEQFEAFGLQILEYYFKDDIAVKMRRLLTIEQFRNPQIGALYKEVCMASALRYQSALFSAMMEAGSLQKDDPELVALSFYAPCFLILYKFSPEDFEEAKALFLRHIRHFGNIYGRK
jgi:hypothetical protein